MKEFPSEKLLRLTRPPCFWNWETAAGAVLKMRHGGGPAVMAAPITSSELLPAGICSAVTCSLAWLWFQAATTASPHFTSSALLEYGILMAGLALPVAARMLPPQAA